MAVTTLIVKILIKIFYHHKVFTQYCLMLIENLEWCILMMHDCSTYKKLEVCLTLVTFSFSVKCILMTAITHLLHTAGSGQSGSCLSCSWHLIIRHNTTNRAVYPFPPHAIPSQINTSVSPLEKRCIMGFILLVSMRRAADTAYAFTTRWESNV